MIRLGLEAKARMIQLLSEKRQRVLTVLTAEYVGGTMTPDKAMGCVAELACLSGLLSSVEGQASEERRRE